MEFASAFVTCSLYKHREKPRDQGILLQRLNKPVLKKMRTKNDMSGEAPEYLKESEGRIILKFFEKLKI